MHFGVTLCDRFFTVAAGAVAPQYFAHLAAVVIVVQEIARDGWEILVAGLVTFVDNHWWDGDAPAGRAVAASVGGCFAGEPSVVEGCAAEATSVLDLCAVCYRASASQQITIGSDVVVKCLGARFCVCFEHLDKVSGRIATQAWCVARTQSHFWWYTATRAITAMP